MASARLPISAFLICKDEAGYIEDCIRSLEVCSEIVVVDSGSTDGTLELLERLRGEGFPLTVLHNDWPGYAAQKQFALERCTLDWCLNIDADERLDDELKAALPELVAAPDGVAGWGIRRRNYLIGYGYPADNAREHHLLRLARRGKARFDPAQLVHETMLVDGEVRKARQGTLLHFRPLFLGEQILKENAYSSLKAEQAAKAGKKARPWKIAVSPVLYFLRLYVGHRLYRCGWPGFIEAGTGAVYAFMTEAKILQRELAAKMPPAETKRDDA